MNDLKFSEDYFKLPEDWVGTQAILTGVLVVSLDKFKMISPAFIEYDTKFRGRDGNYRLDFNRALILSFIHFKSGKPFTTVRRWTGEKQQYYEECLGATFNLVKTEVR